MSWLDFLLLGVVVFWGAVVIRQLYRQKKRGKCIGCSGCNGTACGACRQNKKN